MYLLLFLSLLDKFHLFQSHNRFSFYFHSYSCSPYCPLLRSSSDTSLVTHSTIFFLNSPSPHLYIFHSSSRYTYSWTTLPTSKHIQTSVSAVLRPKPHASKRSTNRHFISALRTMAALLLEESSVTAPRWQVVSTLVLTTLPALTVT